jgi:MFS transporter, SHS family, lactate transporter
MESARPIHNPIPTPTTETQDATPPLPSPKPPADSDAFNTVLASFLGWTLDAFDFFVLIFVLSKAAASFQVSLSRITLAITATLAFRPVGAIIFGLLADRFGRRRPMMWNLVFFSVMEVLSGLAPNFSTFLICRALFGIGMGGEWGVGAALSMEKVPARFRGVFSGILQQGYPTGYLLAAFCFRFVPESWGWRSLFFIGGLPALLAVFVRYRVKESAVWQANRQRDWASLGRAILGNWKSFLYLTFLMTAMNFASHGTQDLYPSFLEQERHLSKTQVANIAIIYNLGAVLGGVTFGLLSDWRGRRCAMVLAFVLAAAMIPLWSAGGTIAALATGAFLMQFMVQGAWGIIPAHITELAPDAVRGFLPGFAYQCGVLLAANSAHFQAQLAKDGQYSTTMALMAFIVFSLGSLIIISGPERRAAPFGVGTAGAAPYR